MALLACRSKCGIKVLREREREIKQREMVFGFGDREVTFAVAAAAEVCNEEATTSFSCRSESLVCS